MDCVFRGELCLPSRLPAYLIGYDILFVAFQAPTLIVPIAADVPQFRTAIVANLDR